MEFWHRNAKGQSTGLSKFPTRPRAYLTVVSLTVDIKSCMLHCKRKNTDVCAFTDTCTYALHKANEIWAKSINEHHLAAVVLFFSQSWLLSRSFTPYPAVLLPKQLWWNFNRSIHCKANSVSRPQQTDNTVCRHSQNRSGYSTEWALSTHAQTPVHTPTQSMLTHTFTVHTPNYQHFMFALALVFTHCTCNIHKYRKSASSTHR